MKPSLTLILASAAALGVADAAEQLSTLEVAAAANPVRKVVTMLQMMSKKIDEEAEREKELFGKFMCYCKGAAGTLGAAVAEGEKKIPELESAIAEMEALLKTLKAEVAMHQKDRADAKAAIKVATEVEEKADAEAEKEIVDNRVYITALEKAIAAIEKGIVGGFLQTSDAGVLKRLVTTADAKLDKLDEDGKALVLAFLSGQEQDDAPAYGNEYVPQSQEIVGMLKQMLDEMVDSQKLEKSDDSKRHSDFKLLVKAKLAEIKALTDLIEGKLRRIGELSVKLVMMREDLEDTKEALGDNSKFLKDIGDTCEKKRKEYELACKMRAEEQVALADTIKVLNDDDALDLFKKTLPSLAQTSLVQVEVSQRQMRARALSVVLAARHGGQRGLDLIALALRGKKVGFDKIISMIEELIATLKKEQTADDDKLEYCKITIDVTEDKAKELGHKISDLETSIARNTDAIIAIKEEIDALEDGIRALDKEVAEATEQRKEEHEDYKALMASNAAAKELLKFAKNRLNKFYNPKLYKPPPKRELTEEERIVLNNGGTLAPTAAPGGIAGTGIAVFAQVALKAPVEVGAPPAGPSGYKKKGEESSGVIQLIDNLVKDLTDEMTAAEAEEKNSQEDYEQFMKDSATKRAEDSKLLVDKKAGLAELETELEDDKGSKAQAEKELMATEQYLHGLHVECDFLMKYYEARKEARTGEIDALSKAKAVLSGADYSLLETSHRHLRGRS